MIQEIDNHKKYRIAGNFRGVLIFAISRTVYGVAKIKTAIIYSKRNSKVGSFEIAKIKIAKIISSNFTFKSRKFSSAKISRYTVILLKVQKQINLRPVASKTRPHKNCSNLENKYQLSKVL